VTESRVKFGLTLPNRGVVIGATTVAEMLQLAADAELEGWDSGHELLAPAEEERIGALEERVGMQLAERGESGVDFALGAGLQDRELHPLRAPCFLSLSDGGLRSLTVPVHEQGDHRGLGSEFGQHLEPLGRQLGYHNAAAGEFATWPRETGDQTLPDGSPNGIPGPRFVLRHNRFRSVPGGTQTHSLPTRRATGC